MHSLRNPRNAVITEIVPSHKYMDGIVERIASECIYALDDCNNQHCFVTGSSNGLNKADFPVGARGTVCYAAYGSYGLWFFKKD